MPSILLVDDSGLFREIAERIELRTHCQLLSADSGGKALGVVRRERPDLVLLDGGLAGMTGFDVCRVIKADSHFSRTPVVIFSDRPGAAEEARRAGADECLAKPFDEEAIFDSIRRHLHLLPRDDPRAAAGWSVTFWRDGAQHGGTLRDLSRGGFFIRTVVQQPVGARLEISFDVPGDAPGRTVVAEALVVRMGQDPYRGLGCRFFRITAGSRANLEECLQMLEGQKSI
ncbi:MAG TPA: response regulator [Thermoanaerobaculia bacterium]|jgi:CheY-like chemotaxis protein